jgi:hypothetical protein
LIRSILTPKTFDRATLAEISIDPWVMLQYTNIPESFIPLRPKLFYPLSDVIMSELKIYGIEDNVCNRDIILTNNESKEFCLYYLVKEKYEESANKIGNTYCLFI